MVATEQTKSLSELTLVIYAFVVWYISVSRVLECHYRRFLLPQRDQTDDCRSLGNGSRASWQNPLVEEGLKQRALSSALCGM